MAKHNLRTSTAAGKSSDRKLRSVVPVSHPKAEVPQGEQWVPPPPQSKPKATRGRREPTEVVLLRPTYEKFSHWLVGDSPLICHAWSQKAREEMYLKQIKALKPKGREPRDPEQDFIDSLYDFGDDNYGFPVTAFKKCMLESAHINRGIAKVSVFPSIILDYSIVSVRAALAGAKCNMPLIRIFGPPPVMREDMGRIGTGLKRTATLLYRGEFFPWAIRLTGRVNTSSISQDALANLLLWSGIECGIGEWRTQRSGVMGNFHPATPEEAAAWKRYVDGKGPLPVPENFRDAAD